MTQKRDGRHFRAGQAARRARPDEGPHARPAGIGRRAGAAGRCAAAARPADRVPAPYPGPLRLHLRRAHRRVGPGDEARDDGGLRSGDVLPPLRRREGRRDPAARAHSPRLRDAVMPDGRRRRSCAPRSSGRADRTSASSARLASAAANMRPSPWSAAIRSTMPRRKTSLPRSPPRRSKRRLPHYVDYAAYRAQGGYRTLLDCTDGKRPLEESSPRWSIRACAAWAAPDFQRAASGASSAPNPRRAFSPSTSMKASREPSRTGISWSATRTVSSKACWSRRGPWKSPTCTSTCATNTRRAARSSTREIAALEADPPCPLPRIHLRRGAGAYICGEESAMIESLEGKRGMPRLRPPYVAQVGLFGRPTLEHNMETLFWIRDILEKGGEAFAAHGRNGRKGLRSFSVSGRVAKPGVHVAPAGITVRELIDEYAGGMLPGHDFYALPSGRRIRRHPAGVARRRPARLRHAAAAWMLHRFGGRHHPVAARPRARRGAQPDALLRRRVVRPVHALPRRHREGRRAARAAAMGHGAARRTCRARWPMPRFADWGRPRRIRSRA